MHLEMRVFREGLKVTDLKTPCIGVHSGRYMGSTKALNLPGDGSVRVLMKGVPSSDMPRGGARSL